MDIKPALSTGKPVKKPLFYLDGRQGESEELTNDDHTEAKEAARSPTGPYARPTPGPTGKSFTDILREASRVVLDPKSSDAEVRAAIARVAATGDRNALAAIKALLHA